MKTIYLNTAEGNAFNIVGECLAYLNRTSPADVKAEKRTAFLNRVMSLTDYAALLALAEETTHGTLCFKATADDALRKDIDADYQSAVDGVGKSVYTLAEDAQFGFANCAAPSTEKLTETVNTLTRIADERLSQNPSETGAGDALQADD